jgi:hypothetical protein
MHDYNHDFYHFIIMVMIYHHYSSKQLYVQAMAETVGSIMTNHSGRGRYLEPVNFSKEIFLGN